MSSVEACPGPDPANRCSGWNISTVSGRPCAETIQPCDLAPVLHPQGSVNCGRGYRQGSALCGTCDIAFYLADDGTCASCPAVGTLWQRYSGLLVVIAAIVGLLVVVWIALVLVVLLRGGTLLGGASRMADLGGWSLSCCTVCQSSHVIASAPLQVCGRSLRRRLYRACRRLLRLLSRRCCGRSTEPWQYCSWKVFCFPLLVSALGASYPLGLGKLVVLFLCLAIPGTGAYPFESQVCRGSGTSSLWCYSGRSAFTQTPMHADVNNAAGSRIMGYCRGCVLRPP